MNAKNNIIILKRKVVDTADEKRGKGDFVWSSKKASFTKKNKAARLAQGLVFQHDPQFVSQVDVFGSYKTGLREKELDLQ